jgi:DnaK suppressor protein
MATKSSTLKDSAIIRQKLTNYLGDIKKISKTAEDSRKPVKLDQQMVGRLSRMDAMLDQEMQLETERRRQLEIERIESAIKRLNDGEYGYCVSCGEPIETKRIINDPTVPTCIGCAR